MVLGAGMGMRMAWEMLLEGLACRPLPPALSLWREGSLGEVGGLGFPATTL